ncbi:MAG: ABC transporter permease [Saprospiraceae bacterium]|nr:ABC transporter permease [Saprospiraceae bacterium]
MIIKIAWRNIWRNKIRSLTVVGSIVIGVWALTFMMAFYDGFVTMYISSAVENDLSHIQIHNPEFVDEKEVKYTIDDYTELIKVLSSDNDILSFASRSLNNGMIANSKGSRGCDIRGIVPIDEAKLTRLDKKIVEGNYFDLTKKKNPIVIGKKLADKMKLKVKSKVVLTFQKTDGELISAAFKVIGIYKCTNSIFEEINLFVQQKDLGRLLEDDQMIHEIALLLKDVKQLDTVQAALASKFPQNLVENYKEISPDVNLYESQMGVITYIFIIIIMFALIFGIINAMLMAILERTRELGMLMSIGMNRMKLFLMIVFETVFIGLIAAPLGLLFGHFTVLYFSKVGIDMTEALEKVGLNEILYPTLNVESYFTITVSVVITAILGAFYPAYKAIRLKPVEAINKI